MHALSSSGGNGGNSNNYRGHSTHSLSTNRNEMNRHHDVTTRRNDVTTQRNDVMTQPKTGNGIIRFLSRERRTCKEQCKAKQSNRLSWSVREVVGGRGGGGEGGRPQWAKQIQL